METHVFSKICTIFDRFQKLRKLVQLKLNLGWDPFRGRRILIGVSREYEGFVYHALDRPWANRRGKRGSESVDLSLNSGDRRRTLTVF